MVRQSRLGRFHQIIASKAAQGPSEVGEWDADLLQVMLIMCPKKDQTEKNNEADPVQKQRPSKKRHLYRRDGRFKHGPKINKCATFVFARAAGKSATKPGRRRRAVRGEPFMH